MHTEVHTLKHTYTHTCACCGLYPTGFLGPLDSPGKNPGEGCHFLLQGIFPTQGLNRHPLHLLHGQVGSLPVSHLGSPRRHLCPRVRVPLPGRHSEAGRASAAPTLGGPPSLLTDPLGSWLRRPPVAPAPRLRVLLGPVPFLGGVGASWSLWPSGPCFPEPSGQARFCD